MNRKIIALLMVLIFALCCVSIAFAENDTIDDLETGDDDVEVEDTSNYIRIVSMSNGEIKFSDGFTGFSLDSTNSPETDDTYTQESSSNSQMENLVKLAIIEAYKQGKENSLGQIISKIVSNDLDTSDSVIKEVASSSEQIKDSEVVNIDNTTEGTFTFELLKSTDDDDADCLAYTVSLRTVEPPIGAADDTADDKVSEDNGTGDADKDTTTDDKKDDTSSADDKKDTVKEDDKKESITENNDTDKTDKTNDTDTNKKTEEKPKQENETIVNKTTTVTTIENNTTIIHNNVKEVNNTTEPENNTVTDLLKAGNPILILIIVVVVAVIAVVVIRRKE